MKNKLIIALWSMALVLFTQTAQAQCPPVAPTLNIPAGGFSVNEGATLVMTVAGGGPVYEWDTDCDGYTIARGDDFTGASFIFTAQNRDGAGASSICVRTVDPRCPVGMDRSAIAMSRVAITNHPPAITTNALISGTVGQRYFWTLNAIDPANPPTAAAILDPLTWSAMGLPMGLTIDAMTGAISGIPGVGTAGNYMVTVNVSDGDGGTATRMLALTITAGGVLAACPAVNILGGGIGGVAIVPEGGVGGFQGVFAGPVPANCGCRIAWDLGCDNTVDLIDGGFTVSGVGRDGPVDAVRLCAAGIPTGACSIPSPVTATPVQFGNVRPTITTAALPAGTVGTGYLSQVMATDPANPANAGGFRDPFTWVAAGLPPGLAINVQAGVIFGTPTMAGMFPVTFTVNDGDGGVHIVVITITINGAMGGTCPVPTLNVNGGINTNEGSNVVVSASLPNPNCGCTVEWDLGCDGVDGIGPNFTVVGVGRDGNSGTRLCYRSIVSVVSTCVSPSMGSTREVNFRNVAPTIVTMALPPGTVGAPYNFTLSATDPANPPIAMAIQDPIVWTAANLPAGLMLDANTGAITGTPNVAGCRDVMITANDGDGGITMVTLQLCINVIAPVVCSLPVPTRELVAPEGGNATWDATLAVNCGCVINWDVGCDGMIEGMGASFMFNAAGRDGPSRLPVCLTARPVAGGACNAASATLLATAAITNVAPTIITLMLPNGTEGVPYMATVVSTDPANPPIAMSVQDPGVYSLIGAPAWLMIDPMTGVISGTPPFGSAGMLTFTVQVVDGDGGRTTQMYTINIVDPNAGDGGVVVVDVPNPVDVPAGADVPNVDVPNVDVPPGVDVPNAVDVPAGADVPNVIDQDVLAMDVVAVDGQTPMDSSIGADGQVSTDGSSADGRVNGTDGARPDANGSGDGSDNRVGGDGTCACRVVGTHSTRRSNGLPALLAMSALATFVARRQRSRAQSR